MNVIRLTEYDDASGATRALYTQVQQKFGALPNFIKAMGDNPAFLDSVLRMHAAVFDGGEIPARYKNLIALAVSMTNGCNYCTSSFTVHAQASEATERELAETRAIVSLLSAYNKFLMTSGIPCDIEPVHR
jgi:AhpD family alkylhydroperoxidase